MKRPNNQFHPEVVGRRLIEDNSSNIRFLPHPAADITLFPTGSFANDRTGRSDFREYSVVHGNESQQSDYSSSTITVSNKHPVDISLLSKLSSKNSSLVTVHDINNTIESLKRTQDDLRHGNSTRRSAGSAKPTQSSSIDSKSRVWIPAPAHTAPQAASFLQSSTTSASAILPRFGSNVSKLSIDSVVSRSKTPTQQNDIIEVRNKKAAEWLHNEKKQGDLRKQEREKSRELAKSIDTQRRAMSQIEATQRIRYQIDMLNADLQQNPLRPTTNKPAVEPQQDSEPHNDNNRTSSEETGPNHKEDSDVVLTRESLTTIRVSKEEIRASNDILIGQMAERFSARKRLSRPMVPRLSKSYVNGQTIFDSRFRYTSDSYPSPSKKSNTGKKKSGKENDSDDSDYSSDEKSSAENEPMEEDTEMNEHAAFMLRLSLPSNKSAPQRDEDGDLLDDTCRAAKKDLITSLAEKELADRREKGKQYLEKKKVSAKKEEENKQSSILQQQQRRKALQDLNNQVLNKNRKNFLNKLKRNSGDLNNIEKLSAENFRPVQSKYSVLTGDIRSSLQQSEAAVGPAVGFRVVGEEKKENLQQQSDSVHSIEGKENGHRESVAQMKATIANYKGPTMESALSSDWGIRQPFAVGSDNLIVVEADDHEHALEKDVETKRESRKNNLAFAPSVVDRNSVDRMDQVPPTHQPHPVKGSVSLVENESQPRLSLSKEPQFTVAIQAKRNFEKVRKVLGDVDRMCSMLHTQTVELEEKLKVRDSVDSFKVDSYKVDPIRVEPSNVYVNANVNDIRSSISEKLYSKVFDLFRADPSNNSSLETKSSADDLSESNHPEAMPNTMASNTSFARNNDSSREDQDSVLMDEYDDRNESIYERTLAPVPETMYDRNGSNGHMRFQEDTSANKNVSSQTRSYVPTPFPVGDPFLTQHLGVLADKKDILGKFSDYIDEYKSDYYSDDEQHNLRQEADRNEVGHIPVEMWSLPGKNMSNNSRRTPSTAFVREPFPSLRNVGELAGLLRTDFEAQVEKMASFGDERNKAVRYSDAEESEDEFSVVALFAKEYMKRATLPPPPPSQDFPVVDDGIPVMGDIAVEDMVNDTPYVETSDQYSDYAEQEDYSRRREEEDQRELQESQTFWNSLLNRPLRNEVVDLMDNDTQHTSFENERILHDLQMNARLQEIQKLESDALKGGTIISPSPLETKPVIKYSAAELRARMVEELRRQEDIFNYTIELAEIQQANSLQAARDLAIQSNTRTEIEIMDLQKRKELELQQLAYENSIAISVANAHLVSEQKNAEQRILVERLQAELEKNQLQQDFSSLLQQASQISANYETNERLLALDKAIDEDKRSRMQQEYEARQKISEAKASAFAAEVVAKAAVQFRQPTIILSNSEQQTDLPPARVGVRGDERIKSSSDSVNNDEYSISFDQESLMASSMIRDMQANDQRKPKSMDVIREGRDSHSSMDENSSEIYEEDDAADQSIMESIATQKVSVGKQRTNITNVDNSYSLPDEVSHDSYGDEINEDSIQESNISRNKSALDHSIQSLVSGTNMSHSILSEKVIKENNRNQKGLHKNQSYQSGVSRTISNSSTAAYDDDEFESSAMSGQSVQEDIKEESNDSIQEESISNNSASLSKRPSTEPPEDDYSSYSDSFASKSLSNASGRGAVSEIHSSQSHSQSISEVHSSQSRSIPSQALPTAKKLLTDGSEIPGTESLVIVHDTQADLDHALALLGDEDPNSQSLNFDERMIHETLELYKKDMEARLRGQERTYALRLRFVKAKKQHRLNLVSSSSHEEKQKVEEEYEEEKAHLERERWTMNANAYKELRKFKQLQKDLLAYNMSLKDSGKSNSEERAKKLADLLSPELNESDSLSSTGSIQEVTFSKARTRKEKVRTEKSGRHVDTTTAATSRLPTSSWRPEKASERFHAVEEVEEYEDADIVSVSEREKSVALKFSSAGDESYVNEDFDEYASSRNSTAVKPKQPLKQALSDSTESIKSGVLTEEFDDDAEDGGGKEIESSVRNSLREQKLLEVSVADEIKDSSASVARSLAADTEHSAEYSMSYDSQSHLQNSLEQNDHAASSSKKYVLDAFEEDDSVVQTESSESRTEDIVANDKDKEASIESKHDNAKKAPLRDHVTTSNDHQDSYGSTADYSLDYDGENSVSRTSVLVNDKADKGPATAIGATADSQPQDMSDEISEDIEEEGDDEHEDADPENHRATHISEHPHHHSPNQSHESLRNLKEQSATENQDLKDSYLDDDDFEDDFEAEEDVSQDPANQNEQLAVEEVTSKSLPKPIVVDDNSFEDEIPEESIASSEKQSEKGDDDGGDDSKFRLDNSADRSADNVELLAIKGDNHQQQLDVLQVKPAVSISPLTETTKTPAATAANNTALLMDDEIDSVMSEVLEEPEAAANDSSFESHSIENTPQKDLQTPVVVASPSDKQAAADYSESEVEQSIDKPSNDVILGSNTTSKANNDNEDDDDNSYEEEFEDDFDDNDGDDNEPTPATLPLPIKTDNQIVKLLPSHGSGVSDDGSIAASVPESIEDDLASEKSASVQVNDAVLKYPRATVGFVDEQNELEEVEREYELDLSDVPDPQNVVSASSISKLRSAASSGNMVFDSEQQKWVGDDVSMDGFSDSDYDFRGHGLDKAVAAPLVAPEDVPITASQHLNLNLSTLSEDSEPHAKNLEINISILSEVSDQPNSALYKKDQFSVLDDEVLEESEDKTIPWVKPVPPAVIEKVDIAANELFGDNYNGPFVQADEDTEFSSDTVEGRLEDLANPQIKILDLKETTTTKDVPKEKQKKEEELQTVDDITSVLFDRMLRDILGTLDGASTSTSASKPVRPSLPARNLSNDDDFEEEEFSSDTIEGPLEYGTVRYDMLIEIPVLDDKASKTDDLRMKAAEKKKSSLSSLSDFPSPLTSVKSKPTILELAKDLDDLYEFDFSGESSSYVPPSSSPITVRTEPVEVSTLGIQDQDNEPSDTEEKRTSPFWDTMVEDTKNQLSEIFETVAMDSIAERLLNPDFKGSFIDVEQAKVLSDHFQSSNQSSSLSCDLLLDRINEICAEMHSMRHGYDSQTSAESRGGGRPVSLSKKMLAQHMPLHQPSHLCEYITSRIASEQQSLVQLLRGEKAMHDHMLNVRTVDELREEVTTALQSASCEVADGILARLLIQTTATCMKDMNLSEEQIQKLIQLSSSS